MGWIDQVAQRMDLPEPERSEVIEELAGHFEQHRNQLLTEGMSEHEAEVEAARILGDPREVAATMQSVHSRVGWKSALLSAAPFLLFALLPLMQIFSDAMHPFWGVRLDASGPWPVYVCGAGAAAAIIGTVVVIVTLGIGVLCSALREIRRGWHNQWVVTALAVGVVLPAWAMVKCGDTSALWRAIYLDHSAWGDLMMILGLLYAILALATAVISASGLGSRIGRISALAAFVATGCAIVGHQTGNMILLIAIPVGCVVALALLAGWRVFAHPFHGSASYWSLFIFSVFMSACLVFPGMMLPGSAMERLFSVTAAGILTACVSSIAFARCSDWRMKKLALMPGIVAGSLLIAFVDDVHIGIWKGINAAEQCALIAAALVYGVPAVYGLVTSAKRSAPASHPLYDE